MLSESPNQLTLLQQSTTLLQSQTGRGPSKPLPSLRYVKQSQKNQAKNNNKFDLPTVTFFPAT